MLAAIAVTGLLLAGCSQGNEPTAYDETTEANFIQGCTGEGTGATGASFDADAAKEAGLPEEPNFVAVNDALEQADDAMPESLEQAIAASCGTSGRPGPDTGGPTTSSTAATGTSAPQ
jgi:hypothetical protein